MRDVAEVSAALFSHFGCAVGQALLCTEGRHTSGKSGCSKTVAASRSGSTVTSFSSSLCPRSCSACNDALHPPDSCDASSQSSSSQLPSCMQGRALIYTD